MNKPMIISLPMMLTKLNSNEIYEMFGGFRRDRNDVYKLYCTYRGENRSNNIIQGLYELERIECNPDRDF